MARFLMHILCICMHKKVFYGMKLFSLGVVLLISGMRLYNSITGNFFQAGKRLENFFVFYCFKNFFTHNYKIHFNNYLV